MPKIARKTQKILGGNSSDNGQFGSAQAGTKILSNDPDVIQSLPAWGSGWNSATVSGLQLPTLEEMQGVQYVQTYQLAYILQEGIAEYDSATTYYQNSIVKKPGTYELYGSITDNNTGNPLTDAVNWSLLSDLGKKNNFEAITSPTVDDDAGEGYGVGSVWFDQSTGSVYFCFEDTIGAADWVNSGVSTGDYFVFSGILTANQATGVDPINLPADPKIAARVDLSIGAGYQIAGTDFHLDASDTTKLYLDGGNSLLAGVIYGGRVQLPSSLTNINAPSAGSVVTATIQNAAVTFAKIAASAVTVLASDIIAGSTTLLTTGKAVKDYVEGYIANTLFLGKEASAYITVTGGVPTLAAQKNIAACTKIGTGIFEITMANAMPDTNYTVTCMASLVTGGGGSTGYVTTENADVARTTTKFRIFFTNGSGGVSDPTKFSVHVRSNS